MTEETKAKRNGKDIVNEILGDIKEGNQTLVDVSRKMLSGGKEQITFAIENRKVQPEPPVMLPRQESPPRAHNFHDAMGFADYLKKYKTTDTVVLVDIHARGASAILDEKATNGFELVVLSPILHPLFVPWEKLLDSTRNISIQIFADFLRKNRRSIVKPEPMELIGMLSQIKVSRNITLHKGFGSRSLNGVVCEMEIAGTTKTEEIQLPEILTIEVPLYVATEAVKLEIDLVVDADDNEVFVKCSSADVLTQQVKVFDSMLEDVRKIEDVVVVLGEPNYSNWTYLKQTN